MDSRSFCNSVFSYFGFYLILCLFLSGCAYGMYDQSSGLFWVDEPISRKIEAQNAVMWNCYYQQQQLFQQMNLNNTLNGMRYGY